MKIYENETIKKLSHFFLYIDMKKIYENMKTFIEFITESKNYPIYKGLDDIEDILESGKITYSGEWESSIRQNMGIKKGSGISVTRFFSTAKGYGSYVLELDTQKLSDNYKIIPFSENPDYYLSIMDKPEVKRGGNWTKNALHDKRFGKEYWDFKTNKNADDFQIAEEVILAKEISIKYIKKVYILGRLSTDVKKLLEDKSIPYEIVTYDDKNLSDLKYKNQKAKIYSPK